MGFRVLINRLHRFHFGVAQAARVLDPPFQVLFECVFKRVVELSVSLLHHSSTLGLKGRRWPLRIALLTRVKCGRGGVGRATAAQINHGQRTRELVEPSFRR